MRYIGIDPGASGGIASIEEGKLFLTSMPNSEVYILQQLEYIYPKNCKVLIEEIIPSGFGFSKSTMAKLYGSYTSLKMALVANRLEYYTIQPKAWQKEIGIKKPKGEGTVEWKARLKRKAQELFPRTVITNATADALLIAEVCRRRFS